MGFSGIGVTELLMILVILLLVVGSNKLRHVGSDLGAAIREFRRAMTDASAASATADKPRPADPKSERAPEGRG